MSSVLEGYRSDPKRATGCTKATPRAFGLACLGEDHVLRALEPMVRVTGVMKPALEEALRSSSCDGGTSNGAGRRPDAGCASRRPDHLAVR